MRLELPAPAPTPGADGHRRRTRRIALAGKLVTAAGVALLVVGGLLWWQEDLSVDLNQGRLADRFTERIALVAGGVPAESLGDPGSGTVPETPIAVEVGDEGDDPRFAAPPAPPVSTTTTVPEGESLPPVLRELAPAEGEPIGRMVIPSIELDWIVVEGIELSELAKGPGHMPWTAVPGQIGNAVISGHRTTKGAPFNRLDLLEAGDEIEITTLVGTHVYEVIGWLTVPPTGVWVTEHRDGAWLTLTTCHPKGSSKERLIVFARLVDGPNIDAVEARYEGVDYSMPDPPEGA